MTSLEVFVWLWALGSFWAVGTKTIPLLAIARGDAKVHISPIHFVLASLLAVILWPLVFYDIVRFTRHGPPRWAGAIVAPPIQPQMPAPPEPIEPGPPPSLSDLAAALEVPEVLEFGDELVVVKCRHCGVQGSYKRPPKPEFEVSAVEAVDPD